MPTLKNSELNEKYNELLVEIQSFRDLFNEVDALDLDEISNKADQIHEAHTNLFEPVLDHENEVSRIPKAQWFDEKFDEINLKLENLKKFEKSLDELQSRAEKLTQVYVVKTFWTNDRLI